MENYASQDDCYHCLRGLKTIGVRLKAHEESALVIAKWLSSINLVDEVLHPALPSHPEYNLWERDFTGSSGLFSLTLKKEYSHEKLKEFCSNLKLFRLGYSWGGYKSLITIGKYKRFNKSRYDGKTVFRLNIGLEDKEDLMEDLDYALGKLGK